MTFVKSLFHRLGLYDQASRAWMWLQPKVERTRRLATFKDRRVAQLYLKQNGPKKLHIGCGPHNLPGWLNADLYPTGNQIRLDATRRFPFDEDVFDYIYSEHMIEHVPWTDGVRMLRECFRVLKPGGVIRIATPDLKFVTRLLRGELSPLEQEYIRQSRDRWTPWAQDATAAYAINNFMRAWGHQFIFDEPTLNRSLALAGFDAVTNPLLQESRHAALSNLAASERMPNGFLALETLVAEGLKPGL
ncbi:methyltransferase domain-containing protein [Prosthecobacter sp.]|uniref:class I SAM-dependent methyltransferase n=1 Tax=Prosthecobacter sp. TaxID=1965333 RepID=UPI002ABCDF95|nr:methyltransferase domain-containing protein [Prosthecobacter sp.]MDZ4401089.1 methyltransferase domain-containing protein [Prosthecobacter sp.]